MFHYLFPVVMNSAAPVGRGLYMYLKSIIFLFFFYKCCFLLGEKWKKQKYFSHTHLGVWVLVCWGSWLVIWLVVMYHCLTSHPPRTHSWSWVVLSDCLWRSFTISFIATSFPQDIFLVKHYVLHGRYLNEKIKDGKAHGIQCPAFDCSALVPVVSSY